MDRIRKKLILDDFFVPIVTSYGKPLYYEWSVFITLDDFTKLKCSNEFDQLTLTTATPEVRRLQFSFCSYAIVVYSSGTLLSMS